MSRVSAIAGRELRSLLLAPGGWIVAAIFSLIIGFVFLMRSFQQGSPASMHLVFDLGTWMLLFIAPAISMRAIADERRTGTYESLVTSPISETQIIVGKFLGLVGFLVLIMLPSLVCVIALERHGSPDYGELLCGYAGLMLAGSAYLAGGILASVLTAHQAVAFLLALFFWLGISLACTQLPKFIDPSWASVIFAVDPSARLNDFTIGLVDTSNVLYFLSITIVFLAIAARISGSTVDGGEDAPTQESEGARAKARGHAPAPAAPANEPRASLLAPLNLAMYILGLVGILVSANYFFSQPALRWTADATKTRAYSLSAQTRQMLDRLDGDWTIAMVLVESDIADAAVLRQVKEVLDRFEEASPRVRVLRIDPTRPENLGQYDALIAELQSRYAGQLREYDHALDNGTAAFETLIAAAGQQVPSIQTLAAALPAGDPLRTQAAQRLGLLTVLAQDGDKVVAEIDKARKTDASSPIADHETAAAILATALPQWASGLSELATLLRSIAAVDALDEAQKDQARALAEPFDALSMNLAVAGDAVKRLPPLELSSIGRQLREGETVLVIGPPGATVVPTRQLFRANLRETEPGKIEFDRRFRGEQVIAAAIQSLIVDHLPLVVFVHAEEGPIIASRSRQVDAVGIAQVLKASRFDVAEWRLADRSSERPTPADGQPVVWVIVPPPQRKDIDTSPAEAALIDATRTLLNEGESVLLSVFPSLLPRYGQKDPWAELVTDWGVTLRTDRVIAEQQAGADGTLQTQRYVVLNAFPSEHPVARAIDGQQLFFNLPTVITLAKQRPSSVRATNVLASIEPSERRWLDREWMSTTTIAAPPPQDDQFNTDLPLVVALERTNPSTNQPQRMLLVAGGGWMLSYIADITIEAAGRITLVNPGNVELMLSGSAWLAGFDELIAQGTTGQEVARLRNVTPEARTLWGWIIIGGVPVGLLLLGTAVWFTRRR